MASGSSCCSNKIGRSVSSTLRRVIFVKWISLILYGTLLIIIRRDLMHVSLLQKLFETQRTRSTQRKMQGQFKNLYAFGGTPLGNLCEADFSSRALRSSRWKDLFAVQPRVKLLKMEIASSHRTLLAKTCSDFEKAIASLSSYVDLLRLHAHNLFILFLPMAV